MHADSSPDAIDLVSSVHLLLSEYDRGDLTESQLRHELATLLNEPMVLSIRIEVGITVSVRQVPSTRRFTSIAWKDVDLAGRVLA